LTDVSIWVDLGKAKLGEEKKFNYFGDKKKLFFFAHGDEIYDFFPLMHRAATVCRK
jgi:hypothetical protein